MNYLLRKDLNDFQKNYKHIFLLLIGYLLNVLIFPSRMIEYEIIYQELFLGISNNILTNLVHILEAFTISFITLSAYYKSIGSSLSDLFLRINKIDWFNKKMVSFIIISIIIIVLKIIFIVILLMMRRFPFNEVIFLYIFKNWLYILFFINLTLCFANTVYNKKTIIYSIFLIIVYFVLIYNRNLSAIVLITSNIIIIILNIFIFKKYREEIFGRLEG